MKTILALAAVALLSACRVEGQTHYFLDDPNITGNTADLVLNFGPAGERYVFTLEFGEASITSLQLLERVEDAIGYPNIMAIVTDTQSLVHIEFSEAFAAGAGWRHGSQLYWHYWTKESTDSAFLFRPYAFPNFGTKIITNGDSDAYVFGSAAAPSIPPAPIIDPKRKLRKTSWGKLKLQN